MLRLVLKVLFVVKVLLLVQLTLLNTDAEVSVTVNTRVQSRNISTMLVLDLVIMILLCCKNSSLRQRNKGMACKYA